MSRWPGSVNVGLRWDPEMGEFLLRCVQCAQGRRARYWPLTLEFWSPSWGMTRCRACWMARKAARNRARWRSDPEWRRRKLEENREQRRAKARFAYRERWERLKQDPVRHAEYLAARREKNREAARRYRARQLEQAA